jgi:hypothetical protein
VEVVDAPVAAAEVTTPPAPRWVATHDAASGCDHWFDLSTFATVHEKPEGFDSTPAAQWIAKADPSGSGHYYYEHRGTGETSWEPPPLRGDDNEAEGAAAAAQLEPCAAEAKEAAANAKKRGGGTARRTAARAGVSKKHLAAVDALRAATAATAAEAEATTGLRAARGSQIKRGGKRWSRGRGRGRGRGRR